MSLFLRIFDKIDKGPLVSLATYWRGYGGAKALYKSFYFWISILLSIAITVVNYLVFAEEKWEWWKDVISIIPSILGFSLGGYAFLVGFGNEKFIKILQFKENEYEQSLYMKINCSFIHFIFVQTITLITTLLLISIKLSDFFVFYFLGIFLFMYSLFTVIATSFNVLNLAKWYDKA